MSLLSYKRDFLLLGILLAFFAVFTPKAHAATLGSASDTITTSRPSPSTPLSANVSVGDAQASVYNNGSTFLASDSAHFWGQTGESLNVATVSAAATTLFFTATAGQAHANGTVVSTSITAVHTIQFTTQTNIPTSGTIVISFPNSNSSDTNQASPSASTFMFNGLSTSNIKANFSAGTSTCTFAISGTSAGSTPTITCTVGTASVAAGTTVTILVGCTTAGTTCAVANQIPTLINPTKTAIAGTADTWAVNIDTTDASSNVLDNTKIKVGTVESVTVTAHIDPTFTFVITGVANNTALTSLCTDGGTNNDTTNSGFATTSTNVNLGTLLATNVNLAAQKMVITSNAINGYTITATSSGHLLNPANGYAIQDAQGTPTGNNTPTPNGATATVTAGSNRFGIHPCDLTAQAKINTTTWGAGTGSANYYANPSAQYYYTLVNSSSGPASSGDVFYIEYAASPQGTTPPGDYHTTLTYVASTTF